MKPGNRTALLALLVTYCAVRFFWWCDDHGCSPIESPVGLGLLKITAWVVPSVAAAMALRRTSLRGALRSLGLDAGVLRGLGFGLAATAPMAIVVLLHPRRAVGGVHSLADVALLGPFAEEVLFRGFLFKALWSDGRWPLPAALIVSAVGFGAAHLPDVDVAVIRIGGQFVLDPALALGSLSFIGQYMMVTAVGGALFAWLFYRLGSLWPVIGLHACMNLWWSLSRHEDVRVVFVPDLAGIGQALSIAIAITLALRRKPVPASANR